MRFNRSVGKSRAAGLQAGGLLALFTPVMNLMFTFILGLTGFALLTGRLPFFNVAANPLVTVGTLFLFFFFLRGCYRPPTYLSKVINITTSAITGAERIQEVFDQAPEVTEECYVCLLRSHETQR